MLAQSWIWSGMFESAAHQIVSARVCIKTCLILESSKVKEVGSACSCHAVGLYFNFDCSCCNRSAHKHRRAGRFSQKGVPSDFPICSTLWLKLFLRPSTVTHSKLMKHTLPVCLSESILVQVQADVHLPLSWSLVVRVASLASGVALWADFQDRESQCRFPPVV